VSTGSSRRRFARGLFICSIAGLSTYASACVILDAPAELPAVVARRPTIRRAEAAPPTSRILRDFPPEFVVPIEVGDRSDDFAWNVFVDYGKDSNSQFPATSGESRGANADTDAGVRIVSFQLDRRDPENADFRACHVIEFLVAQQFSPASPRLFSSVGGDSMTWFVNPTGTLVGCPEYDGGSFALPDAGSDSSSVSEGGPADAGASESGALGDDSGNGS